jgi:SnoaL-like domain
MESQSQAVRDAADVSAVSQLILRERLSRDLGLWEQMRDCFHDDSVVRIGWINASGPEFVRRSKEMAERNVKATHRLGPIFVTLAGERAIAQLNATIDIPFTLKGTDVMVSSHTRFLFRAERRQDVWRLSGFDCVYLRDEMSPVLPGQAIAVDWAGLSPPH